MFVCVCSGGGGWGQEAKGSNVGETEVAASTAVTIAGVGVTDSNHDVLDVI